MGASSKRLVALVLHAMRDQFCPCDEGQHLAALIPDARFVAVDSSHALPLVNDLDWPASAALIDAFLISKNLRKRIL